MVIDGVAVATARGIRVMRGGGPVFAHHALISPNIAWFAALIVDPARIDELADALVEAGWTWRRESGRQLLPPTIRSFVREGFDGDLNLYGPIPGFFCDPNVAFDRLWQVRESMLVGGASVPILGKLPTVMFAAHNRLGGQRWRRARKLHFSYFLDQFQKVLAPDERISLQAFARDLGAEDEVRDMLIGLDLSLGPAAHPDENYLRNRLGLERVTAGDAWLVTRLERPRGRRDPFPGVAAASAALIRLVGARRRLGL
jgi:hypothetical protein